MRVLASRGPTKRLLSSSPRSSTADRASSHIKTPASMEIPEAFYLREKEESLGQSSLFQVLIDSTGASNTESSMFDENEDSSDASTVQFVLQIQDMLDQLVQSRRSLPMQYVPCLETYTTIVKKIWEPEDLVTFLALKARNQTTKNLSRFSLS